MRVFISYASEDRHLAEQIHFALLGAGHKTFYDKESLPAGGDFNARIQAAVEQSDLFVFLISPDSVQQGNYALTELRYARLRWRHPRGRVLPVMLRRTPWEQVPAYLSSVTVLELEGNVPAEVALAVRVLGAAIQDNLAKRIKKRLAITAFGRRLSDLFSNLDKAVAVGGFASAAALLGFVVEQGYQDALGFSIRIDNKAYADAFPDFLKHSGSILLDGLNSQFALLILVAVALYIAVPSSWLVGLTSRIRRGSMAWVAPPALLCLGSALAFYPATTIRNLLADAFAERYRRTNADHFVSPWVQEGGFRS
jgi:hypothetical protein